MGSAQMEKETPDSYEVLETIRIPEGLLVGLEKLTGRRHLLREEKGGLRVVDYHFDVFPGELIAFPEGLPPAFARKVRAAGERPAAPARPSRRGRGKASAQSDGGAAAGAKTTEGSQE